MSLKVRSWEVYDGGTLILEVSDAPGPLMSTAAPPPDFRPPNHPFLSATAHSADHEDKLRKLLEASTSVADFLDRLRGEGFEIRPVESQ